MEQLLYFTKERKPANITEFEARQIIELLNEALDDAKAGRLKAIILFRCYRDNDDYWLQAAGRLDKMALDMPII